VPTDIKPGILTTAINEDDGTASLALAKDVAKYFELHVAKVRDISRQVGKAVSKWRAEAAHHGIAKGEIDRMASAFEHKDLEEAVDSSYDVAYRLPTLGSAAVDTVGRIVGCLFSAD
jgi:serine/threonine-protein kinase HipA